MGQGIGQGGGGDWGGQGTFWGLNLTGSVFGEKAVGSADAAKKRQLNKYK